MKVRGIGRNQESKGEIGAKWSINLAYQGKNCCRER